jgi:hypothetical protein
MVGAVLLARVARRIWQRRHGLVRISYPDGRIVEVTPARLRETDCNFSIKSIS